jgi:hypothetical protein
MLSVRTQFSEDDVASSYSLRWLMMALGFVDDDLVTDYLGVWVGFICKRDTIG